VVSDVPGSTLYVVYWHMQGDADDPTYESVRYVRPDGVADPRIEKAECFISKEAAYQRHDAWWKFTWNNNYGEDDHGVCTVEMTFLGLRRTDLCM
jgi:hypothetical protein